MEIWVERERVKVVTKTCRRSYNGQEGLEKGQEGAVMQELGVRQGEVAEERGASSLPSTPQGRTERPGIGPLVVPESTSRNPTESQLLKRALA